MWGSLGSQLPGKLTAVNRKTTHLALNVFMFELTIKLWLSVATVVHRHKLQTFQPIQDMSLIVTGYPDKFYSAVNIINKIQANRFYWDCGRNLWGGYLKPQENKSKFTWMDGLNDHFITLISLKVI